MDNSAMYKFGSPPKFQGDPSGYERYRELLEMWVARSGMNGAQLVYEAMQKMDNDTVDHLPPMKKTGWRVREASLRW